MSDYARLVIYYSWRFVTGNVPIDTLQIIKYLLQTLHLILSLFRPARPLRPLGRPGNITTLYHGFTPFQHSVLNVKLLVAALAQAFSVIVKLSTSRRFVPSSSSVVVGGCSQQAECRVIPCIYFSFVLSGSQAEAGIVNIPANTSNHSQISKFQQDEMVTNSQTFRILQMFSFYTKACVWKRKLILEIF